MNVVFFASDNFAVPSLEALSKAGHKICAVITQPDKKRGRGLALSETAVKEEAKKLGLKVYQPENLNKKEVIALLKGFSADLFVVIAYGQILPQEALDAPKILSLNIHASLLPKYRGAAPINWAIINGEKLTGVSAIKMVKQMDAGPIAGQKKIEITQEDNALTLEEKLSKIGADLLLETLSAIENTNCNLLPQQEEEATFAPKLKKLDGLIDWNKEPQDIYNLIRGALGWPGAFTYYKGKLLKIYKAKVRDMPGGGGSPGEILHVSSEGLTVATAYGNLLIEELQIEAKRRMNAGEFIQGHRVVAGDILGESDF